MTYINDGHGFTVRGTFPRGRTPTITGGPLGTDVYAFFNFHLHWSSEHTIDGQSYAAELHIVHFNTKYGDITTALGKSDGLAVVGVTYEVAAPDGKYNAPRRAFFRASRVARYGSTPFTESTGVFPVSGIFPGYRTGMKVYSYEGSLTVPNCNEAVTWMVVTEPVKMFGTELRILKAIRDSHGDLIAHNNRPVQPLNNRAITMYG
jgi:carbonic anhydrase 2